MNLEGRIVRLRAVEPEDAELLYAWENDTSVWSVSGTTEPFSRAQMERFIAAQLQGGDLFRTGQLRLIVETRAEAPRPVCLVLRIKKRKSCRKIPSFLSRIGEQG